MHQIVESTSLDVLVRPGAALWRVHLDTWALMVVLIGGNYKDRRAHVAGKQPWHL